MRKILWVLLGLVIFAGAVSLAGYRHVYEPQHRARNAASTPAAAPPATRGLQQTPPAVARAPATAPTTTTTAINWTSFETLVNIANLVVGLLGIYMTIAGMRMQRQAMLVHADRERR